MNSRRRYVLLYGVTLIAVCASVIVGPAVSGELSLVPNSFTNPAGNSAPSGSVTSGNGSDSFHWSNAAFTLIDGNLVKISLETVCVSSFEPCDKIFPTNADLVFQGDFIGTGFDTGTDTIDFSLTGEYSGSMDLIVNLTLQNSDNLAEIVDYGMSFANGGSPIALSFPIQPVVPYQNFLGTLALTFFENTGTSDFSNSADAQFNFTPAAVPEPTSLALFAGGLGLLAFLRRKIRTE